MNDSAIFGMLGLLIGGGVVGMVTTFALATSNKTLEEASAALANAAERYDQLEAAYRHLCGEFGIEASNLLMAEEAHSRLSDAHNTQSARIERALACVTDRSAHVGKKMAAILRGERL